MWTDGEAGGRVGDRRPPVRAVRVTATDLEYDEEKKKLTFADGTVMLADGTEMPVANGHLAADRACPRRGR